MDRSGNLPSPRGNFQYFHTDFELCPTLESNAGIVRMHMEDVDGQSRENTVDTGYPSASDLREQVISKLPYMTPGHLVSSS